MLLEKNSYPDDFPLSIRIVNITEYPIHYHQDIEIVFVLKGEIKLKNGYCTYLLREGDIFTNNGHEVHAIYKAHGDNVVAIIRVSNLFFTQYFPELSKSCYRTYTPKETDRHCDNLRKMLLLIILDYLKKSINYKHQCINSMLEVIQYLNDRFNLFAFENQVVVNVSNDNAVLVERMSRIINYIYENHSEKITLEDLAELEHLSKFYLSHIIKQFTGMSFRDVLCFARAEWSEIYLLGTDKTINAIAKEVGFSTTSFYEKHFIKWFGSSPEEHRIKYAAFVKSAYRPEVIDPLPVNRAISIIKQGLSSIISQDKNASQVKQLKLDIHIDAAAEPMYALDPEFEISITLRDYETLRLKMYDHLTNFHCRKVAIRTADGDAPDQLSLLKTELAERGYEVDVRPSNELKGIQSYGLDSVANLIRILKENLLNNEGPIPVSLMDCGGKDVILKGMPSILTSCAIPKPSYYGYLCLSLLCGHLICWGKHYSVVRIDGEQPGFIVIVCNYNDAINSLCTRNATIHETQDIINKFNDELDINFTLNNLSGNYVITRYSMDSHNNIFDYMSKLNFPDRLDLIHSKASVFYTAPKVEVFAENITQALNLNISLKGAGIQLVKIEVLATEDNFEQ